MTILVLLCLLGGMVIAQRFKVLVLVPTIFVALVFAVGTGISRDESFLTVLATAAIVIACVQIGYLLGAAVYHLFLLARANRFHSRTLPNALPPRRAAH
jgi:hypothetical protein